MSGAPKPTAEDIPEITSEMIEAGQDCLESMLDASLDSGSESGLMCIPAGWAEAVYRAMHEKRGHQGAVSTREG